MRDVVYTKKQAKKIESSIKKLLDKFKCVHCDSLVLNQVGADYVIEEGKAYCTSCYEKIKLKKIKKILGVKK